MRRWIPTACEGMLAIPSIIGLVAAAKQVGLDTVWATPLAVVFGLAISVGHAAARVMPGSEVWLDAMLGMVHNLVTVTAIKMEGA